MLNGYTIGACLDGGFIVGPPKDGDIQRMVVFAGTLEECIAYVSAKLSAVKRDKA